MEKRTINKTRLKYLLILPLTITGICIASHAFSQGPPPPQPPPPPGELLKRINPFKRHKKDTASSKVDTANNAQVGNYPPPPPRPPDPMDLFRKKKDTTKNSKN
jgi:hypothetical protein